MPNDELVVLKGYDGIATLTDYKSEMIAIMHKTVAKGTTTTELAFFLTVCKSLELNPLNREVWCYKDSKDNLLIFTGRDGFLIKAQRHPDYGGLRSCEVCENDVFDIDIANNIIVHKFGTAARGKIIGGYAIAFRKGCEPTIEWANITDYNKNRNTWNAFEADMIKKVAECHALKKAFGIANLVSEYDFQIKNGIAYAGHNSNPDQKQISKPLSQDKSEERLLTLIESCKSRKELTKFQKDLKTQEHRDAYDEKYKSLE